MWSIISTNDLNHLIRQYMIILLLWVRKYLRERSKFQEATLDKMSNPLTPNLHHLCLIINIWFLHVFSLCYGINKNRSLILRNQIFFWIISFLYLLFCKLSSLAYVLEFSKLRFMCMTFLKVTSLHIASKNYGL